MVLVSYMDILWQETEHKGSLSKSGVGLETKGGGVAYEEVVQCCFFCVFFVRRRG